MDPEPTTASSDSLSSAWAHPGARLLPCDADRDPNAGFAINSNERRDVDSNPRGNHHLGWFPSSSGVAVDFARIGLPGRLATSLPWPVRTPVPRN